MDVFHWMQGLVGLYPFIGVTVVVSALIVLIAATGVRPGRTSSHSLRSH